MTMVSTEQQRGRSPEEFRSVLTDIVKVVATTGARPGLTRSLQVARAVTKLFREFTGNQASFQDQDGQLAPPKIVKPDCQ